jgi:hypothetical protein
VNLFTYPWASPAVAVAEFHMTLVTPSSPCLPWSSAFPTPVCANLSARDAAEP